MSFQTIRHKLADSNTITFILVVTLAMLLIKIPTGILLAIVNGAFGGLEILTPTDEQNPAFTIADTISAVVIAPVLETLIGQFLPIVLLSRFTKNWSILMIFSATIFAFLHWPVVWFLLTAFCIGIILAWAYLVQSKKGKLRAFCVVTVIHGLHNLAAFLFAYLFSLAGMN